MSNAKPPSLLPEEDYEAIENAVMETERGRWFLKEYARRNRHADTEMLLGALSRIEKIVEDRPAPQLQAAQPEAAQLEAPLQEVTQVEVPRLEAPKPEASPQATIQLDIAEMFDAIARTKREIAELGDDRNNTRFSNASAELDAIVSDTERATQEILASAENLQEIAWTLREAGIDAEVCNTIDRHATDIYMACSFQDLTGQRTSKVVQVLNYLEVRLKSMMTIWGPVGDDEPTPGEEIDPTADSRPDAHLLNGPQLAGLGISQDAVDEMFAELACDEVDLDKFDVGPLASGASAPFEDVRPDADALPDDVIAVDPAEAAEDAAAFEAGTDAAADEAGDAVFEDNSDGLTPQERMALFA